MFLRIARKRRAGSQVRPRKGMPQPSTTSGCAIEMAMECRPIQLYRPTGCARLLRTRRNGPVWLPNYSRRVELPADGLSSASALATPRPAYETSWAWVWIQRNQRDCAMRPDYDMNPFRGDLQQSSFSPSGFQASAPVGATRSADSRPKSVEATPRSPARPVRPTRWIKFSATSGKS